MKTYFFCISFFLISAMSFAQASAQKGCRDSSIRLRYLVQNQINNFNFFGEKNGMILHDSSLVKIISYQSTANQLCGVVSKFDKNYNSQWSNSYKVSGRQVYFLNSKELTTGELLVTGHVGMDPSLTKDTAARYFIMLLNKSGSIIWQQTINHPLSIQLDFLKTKAITDKNGEIYLLLNDAGYVHVLNIHHNGSIGWCKTFAFTYLLDAGINGFFVNGNYLDIMLMTGGAIASNGVGCSGIYLAKIDISSGNIVVQKDYCYNIAPNSYESPVWQSIHTGNNLYALTMVNDNTNNAQNFTVFYFDTSLSPVKTIIIKQNQYPTPGINDNCITVNSKGQVCVASFWDDNINFPLLPRAHKLAYAIIDSNGTFLQQKKAIAGGDNEWHSYFPHYFINPGNSNRFPFSYYYQSGSNTFIDYYDLSDSINTNDNCLGYDSTIFSLSYINATSINWKWDSIFDNHFNSRTTNVVVAPFNYVKTEVCKKLVVCDTLKIAGPTELCVSLSPVKYTVFKNPLCDKKIKFMFDSSYGTITQNDGDSVLTLSFKKPGKVKLYALIEDCILSDSIEIVLKIQKTTVTINKDSLLCPGKTMVLQADKGFESYLWQNGNKNDNLIVTDTGFYKVVVTDSCGNIFSDSVTIHFADTTFALPTSSAICNTDTFSISVPQHLSNLTWQPSSGITYSSGNLIFNPSQSTTYTIGAESSKNCIVEKQIAVIIKDCPANIFFPNSFTPDGNGRNDIFKPFFTLPLEYYRLTIYNRFGRKVFESINPQAGWNGQYGGVLQNSANFVYYCTYKFYNKLQALRKGNCLLIR